MGFFKNKNKNKIQPKSTSSSQTKNKNSTNDIKTNLQENIHILKDSLGDSTDIIIREINIGKEESIKAGIIYTDGLTNTLTFSKMGTSPIASF